MRIHTIEHVPFEGPAAIATVASKQGHELARTRTYAGEPLPGLDDFDLLAVMGGPMGVHDTGEFSWLVDEIRYIRIAAESGKRVLGVCLGAQLLAFALGAEVTRQAEREIGWFPVELTPDAGRSPAFAGFPERCPAFHWHGDTFAIPAGATRLAFSQACANQAFAIGASLVGLQFHLETTPESMELLIEHCSNELGPGRWVQTPEQMRAGLDQVKTTHRLLETLLKNME